MTEPYDVGVLIHFAEGISEELGVELIELAHKWDAQGDVGWPFGVAILPVGEYLMFVFQDPDNANMFIAHAEKRLQAVEDRNHGQQLYTIIMCWTGLLGGERS
jgi:hypothetical protein